MADAERPFEEVRFAAPDGLTLYARVYGGQEQAATLPVVCLPGLTRNSRDFHELALYLSQAAPRPRKVVTFDYRGRGGSDYDPDWQNYTVLTETQDVLAGLDALGIDRAAFIGTSRGGLIVHVLVALHPQLVAAIVLNDIGPVVEPVGLEDIRTVLQNRTNPSRFEDVALHIRRAYAATFPALTDADWLRMAHALYREQDGRPVADYDPNLLNLLNDLDVNKPLPDLWEQFQALLPIPVLVLRGEHSTLLSQETVEEMARRHQLLEAVIVAGQGHAPLLETADLPQRIAAFLDRSISESA